VNNIDLTVVKSNRTSGWRI